MNLSILVGRACRKLSFFRKPSPSIPSAFLLIIFALALQPVRGQRICGPAETVISQGVLEENGSAAPLPDVIIIPVVVHIIYNTPEQNITNDQVRSQIAVLNRDFRRKNADASNTPSTFRELAADARIEFRLATEDPAGLPTNGIIRRKTDVTGFSADDRIKYTASGGHDAWNRDEYLNIWVGNMVGGMMGYSSSPGCAAEKDGVVIRYSVFGTTANVPPPFNKGRTAVHEIGHWLGLRHIWGDSDCGDDKVDDTPPQQGPTRGCPSGVVSTCTSGSAGNMYMNFMDFTNDECTNMFTHGQATRMRQQFTVAGHRLALLTSGKAEGAVAYDYSEGAGRTQSSSGIYPNPASSFITVSLGETQATGGQIQIFNYSGQLVYVVTANAKTTRVDISSYKSGVYFVSYNSQQAFKFVKSQQ